MRIMPERLTVGRLMIGIALLAVVLAAVLYSRENANVDQAMVTADLRALNQDDPGERRRAAGGLGMMVTTNHAPVAAALAAVVLGDPVAEVRQVAVGSLGQVLVAWARGKSALVAVPGVPGNQAPPLGDADDEASAVRALLRALGDPQAEVRHAAVEAFSRLQNGVQLAAALDAESFAALDRLLTNPESGPDTRTNAVWCLARMVKPTPEGRARALATLETDPAPAVRALAIRALVQGWPAVDLYPVLLAHGRSTTSLEERSTVSWMLGGLPAPPAEVIPELIDLMKTDRTMAETTPTLLGKLGRAGRPWLAALATMAEAELQQADIRAKLPAVLAIIRIDPDSPEAQALLGPLWERARQVLDYDFDAAHLALNEFRGSAAALVPTLRAALRDPDPQVRDKAASLLGRIGPPAVAAIADLEAALREQPSWTLDGVLSRLRPFQTD